MTYDLHIVRTADWLDAASAPITRQDADALIAADAELAWSRSDYVDMSDDQGIVTRYYMIAWHGEPDFWWFRDEIRCANPSEAHVAKMVEMARALEAFVIGDDGALYPLEETSEPTVKSAADRSGVRPGMRVVPFWAVLLGCFLLGCLLVGVSLLVTGI